MTKTDWDNLHIISSFLWVVALLFHVYFNWGILKAYIYRKAKGGFQRKTEMAVALAVGVVVVIVSLHPVPPISSFLGAGDSAKEAWITSPDHEPPFGHAEQVSLKSLAARQNIALDLAVTELAKYGIVVADTSQSVDAIALTNNVSPMQVYLSIRPLEQTPPTPAAESSAWTPELVEESFTGRGLGQKDLTGAAEMIGMTADDLRARLEAKGVTVEDGENFKAAAARYGVSGIDLLKAALVTDHKLPSM